MLYERWRQIARECRSRIALRDLSRGEHWTFADLEKISETPSEQMVSFPHGASAQFIFDVLQAWRGGRVVCPLEPGQRPPVLTRIPPGIVHLKTTSATTRAPRLVACTAAQLAADADNIVQTMGLRPDWPNLGVISLAHSYGFSNLVTPLLLHGIPLALMGSTLPEALRRTIDSLADLTLPSVPALWQAWHEAGAIPKNIRLAISAGAPLPLTLEQSIFSETGIKVHNFYGATECGGIAYDDTEAPRTDAALIGRPMKNVTVLKNGDGCLEVRSGAVAETYWPEPEPGLAAGCYRSSDVVDLVNGCVFLRGRVSDQINVAGRKILPESIERILRAHPEVRECLVFGVPSFGSGRSEVAVACVAVRSPVGAGILKQFLLAQLPAWQVPRDWWFVEALGANQRGKTSRAEWRQKYLEERSRDEPRKVGGGKQSQK